MKAEGGEFVLEIIDNGRGITEDEKTGSQSLGLLGYRNALISSGERSTSPGLKEKERSLLYECQFPARIGF
jgi:hypothetical protein